MSPTFLYILCVILVVVSWGLVHYVIRDNASYKPAGGFQWGVVTLATVVTAFCGYMVGVVASPEAAAPTTPTPLLETASLEPGEMDQRVSDFQFQLVTADETASFADLRGQVVLVNIWATWCAPCRFELPELNRLQVDYRDEGLVVLNLSDEPREDLLTYQTELPLETVSGYVDPATLPEPLRRNFQVRPTSFVIDREGVLRESALGMRSYSQFLSMIQPYLTSDVAADV